MALPSGARPQLLAAGKSHAALAATHVAPAPALAQAAAADGLAQSRAPSSAAAPVALACGAAVGLSSSAPSLAFAAVSRELERCGEAPAPGLPRSRPSSSASDRPVWLQ